MKAQRHHIQKQQLQVDFATEDAARRWNRNLPAFYYAEILPQMALLLDEYIPENRSYLVNRLQIDLGSVSMDEFKTVFIKKLEAALIHLTGIGQDSAASAGSAVLTANRKEKRDNEEIPMLTEKHESHLDSLYYLLDQGVLPWNCAFSHIAGLEAAVMTETGVEKLVAADGFRLRMQRPAARKRLYYQFSRPFTEAIISRLYHTQQVAITALANILANIFVLFADRPAYRKKIKKAVSGNESVFAWIGISSPADTGDWPLQFTRWALQTMQPYLKAEADRAVVQAVVAEIPGTALAKRLADIYHLTDGRKTGSVSAKATVHNPGADTAERAATALPDDSIRISSAGNASAAFTATAAESPDVAAVSGPEDRTTTAATGKRSGPRQQSDPRPGSGNRHIAGSAIPGVQEDDVRLQPEATVAATPGQPGGQAAYTAAGAPHHTGQQGHEFNEATPKEADVYYTGHAGIVLCWPYLSRLFSRLDYLEGTSFKTTGHQERAVHLLAFIASGSENREEHELVMAKQLCGWPLQMPIIKLLTLTDREKQGVHRMLDSLISNWAVLKNTSAEGLRSSFFDRKGKLFREDGQWTLIVEQKSYDMLLDQLPYPLSFIKLPWMKPILKVDWA